MRRFPDVQALIITYLETLVGAGHVGYETPDNLEAALPYIRVRRAAGSSSDFVASTSVALDVFDLLYSSLEPLTEQVRQQLCGPPPPIALIDRIDCVAAPQEVPWADGTPVRRFAAVYHAEARRHTT